MADHFSPNKKKPGQFMGKPRQATEAHSLKFNQMTASSAAEGKQKTKFNGSNVAINASVLAKTPDFIYT